VPAELGEPPDEEGDEIAWLLAEAGGRMRGAWKATHLKQFLGHASPRVREAALRASARCGLPELPGFCREATVNSAPLEAIEFLGVVGSPEDLSCLQRAAQISTDPAAAKAALNGLGRLGLPAPPQAHRVIVEARVGFALLRGDEAFAHRLLEVFHGLSFETDPSELVTHELQRARFVYPILMSLLIGNSAAFDQDLIKLLDDFHPVRRQFAFDIGTSITALGFIRLAQMRGMTVNISHPDLPLALLDPTPT